MSFAQVQVQPSEVQLELLPVWEAAGQQVQEGLAALPVALVGFHPVSFLITYFLSFHPIIYSGSSLSSPPYVVAPGSCKFFQYFEEVRSTQDP